MAGLFDDLFLPPSVSTNLLGKALGSVKVPEGPCSIVMWRSADKGKGAGWQTRIDEALKAFIMTLK